MRDRVWAELQDKKFQETYLDQLSKRAHRLGNLYSFFLVFSSAGCVAAWSIWEVVPGLWGGVVAVSQFLHLAKPFIPALKNENEYIQMSQSYGGLYLFYEELWCDIENNQIEESEVSSKYKMYRRKDLEAVKKFSAVQCPEDSKLMTKSSELTTQYLSRHY